MKIKKKDVGRLFMAFCVTIFFAAAVCIMEAPAAIQAAVTIEKNHFPDDFFRNYISTEYDANHDGELSDSELKKITTIEIRLGNLASLDLTGIEYLKSLKSLYCVDYHLTSLDVSKNLELESITCERTGLTTLDVSGNLALKYLDCDSNFLTQLDVSKNTALIHLNCGGNRLTSIDVSKNTLLKALYCGGNQLASVDVSNNSALRVLNCSSNKLTSVDISKNLALEDLNCSGNQISGLDVSKHVNLIALNCNENQITSLDVRNNPALEYLHCAKNQITALDVRKNPELYHLGCGGNKLIELNLSDNPVLEDLTCGNNQITVLDISKNPDLDRLYCPENPLNKIILTTQNTQLTLTTDYIHNYRNVVLSDITNIELHDMGVNNICRIEVLDKTKPATYHYEYKEYYTSGTKYYSGDMTIIYVESGGTPDIPDDEESLDTTPVSHFYEDHNYAAQATNSTVRIYANGGTVMVPGETEKKNYKRCVIYTDILPSYIYMVGKNGAIKPSSGKVVVGITATNQKPELIKGKILDKNTSKIASASIKNGQITVTAKSQPGKVYLWAIDTGRVGESACIPVTVKAAPTATNIYAVPDTDSSFTYGKTKQFKSGKISVGKSAKVYLYPIYKENGAVQKAKKVSYTASVAAKSADYFSVKQSGSNPLCFEISAKSLKNGKSVTGAITFTCNLNGRKVAFKATAIN